MKIPVPCKMCGKERMVDNKKQTPTQYLAVSPNCRVCATKDPEVRAKISKGWFTTARLLGNKNALGNIPWNKDLKGIHLSPISEFTRDRTLGEKNNRWRGGITSENMKIRQSKEYKDWRTAVFKRDCYTCQDCGEKGYRLNADHIKPFAYFPELRLVLENGRTLCVECHRKTPTYSLGGRKIYGTT